MATTNYSFNLPVVGGDEDAWGALLNANWTALDTLLGGANATEFAILDGATVSTAELNLLDGLTAKTGADTALVTGTAGSAGNLIAWNADGDAVDAGISSSGLGSPTGTITWHAANTPPTGYLKANGAAVSRDTYSALFAVIGTTFGAGDGSTTFNVPDLRGEFVRGWDDARGIDTGRVFGSAQSDDNKSHTHTGSAATAGTHSHTVGRSDVGGGGTLVFSPSAPNGTAAIPTGGAHSHTLTINASGGTEARPRNIALLACIKF